MNIIAIGDSLTEGYITKERKMMYPYTSHLRKMRGIGKVKNIGVSGFTSSQIYNHLQKQKLTGYDTAIILSGTNDLLKKKEELIFDNNVKIYSYLLDRNLKHIFILSLPQIVNVKTNRPIQEKKRIRLNSKMNAWCELNSFATYIPFGEYFLYHARRNVSVNDRSYGTFNQWAHNGYHLSKLGYMKMADFIYMFLNL
jgi:lysophospholipase L1-like esterase